ncbi:MAG TPA: CotH kinase family protein [Kofleriaceae bacterium]|nr:CotH kinase family protein [Kofleriaceae bacterium]
MRLAMIVLVCGLVGCGGSSTGGDDDGGPGGGDAAPSADAAYPGTGDDLDTATGCPGVYNPDQVLAFHLTMSAGDWQTVQNDCTFLQYVPAQLSCGDGPAIQVGVRHKRSGGTMKPGLKIDINQYVAGQEFYGLRKLDWENGVGSAVDGCGSDGSSSGAMLSEYLGWRLHVRSGEMTSRAAFVTVTVNGDDLGAFLSVEQVDKPFVGKRLGDASGWIWKFSGSPGDGQQTNLGVDDPYDDYFCFFAKNGCPMPSASQLAADLPSHLNITQLLSVGAVNALMANHDAIMLKLNNFIYYDYAGGPRAYFPWDLDTTMADDYDVYTGTVPGGTTVFTDALFSNWQDDYTTLLGDLLSGPLSLANIDAEIDRGVTVAGPALEADPFVGGSAAAAGDDLKAWWATRHADVSAQVAAH